MLSPHTPSGIETADDPVISAQQRSTYAKIGSVLTGTMNTADAVLSTGAYMAGRTVHMGVNTIRSGINGLRGKSFSQGA